MFHLDSSAIYTVYIILWVLITCIRMSGVEFISSIHIRGRLARAGVLQTDWSLFQLVSQG